MRLWSSLVVIAGILVLAGCTKCSQQPSSAPEEAAIQDAPQGQPSASEIPPAGGPSAQGSEGGTVDTLLDESGGIEDLPASDNLEIEDEEPSLEGKSSAAPATKTSPKSPKSSK